MPFLFIGCGQTEPKSERKSPSQVVKAAYIAANSSKYLEIERYLSAEALSVLKGEMGTRIGGMTGVWDKATRNRTIEIIEVLKEEIRGDRALVLLKAHYKDGSVKKTLEPLIKENGVWKMTLSPEGRWVLRE